MTTAPASTAAGAKLFEHFGIRCETLRSSALAPRGAKQLGVLDLCRTLGADTYVSGLGAAGYQDAEAFAEAGVELQ